MLTGFDDFAAFDDFGAGEEIHYVELFVNAGSRGAAWRWAFAGGGFGGVLGA